MDVLDRIKSATFKTIGDVKVGERIIGLRPECDVKIMSIEPRAPHYLDGAPMVLINGEPYFTRSGCFVRPA